jgi:hypothetical protein
VKDSARLADFVPAARIARKLNTDFYLGVEYYGDYGKIGNSRRLRSNSNCCLQ